MSLVATAKGKLKKNVRVLAVDPASHSMAFALMERKNGKEKLLYAGKLLFPMPNVMETKQNVIMVGWEKFFELMKGVDHVVIEQSIYIQNPQTSRILAYLTGALWQASRALGASVSDVPPMTWKSWLGYKRIMPAEKKSLIAKMGEKEAKKFMNLERKVRVKKLLADIIPETQEIEDYDILDAIAISYWAINEVIK